jgi:hypothetical protein
VVAIVAADTDDFGWRDGWEQVGGGEGKGLEGQGGEVEIGRGGVLVGEMVSQIFLRGVDEVGDPELAIAVFEFAVVGLAIEQEAAVFHGDSPGADNKQLSMIGICGGPLIEQKAAR